MGRVTTVVDLLNKLINEEPKDIQAIDLIITKLRDVKATMVEAGNLGGVLNIQRLTLVIDSVINGLEALRRNEVEELRQIRDILAAMTREHTNIIT